MKKSIRLRARAFVPALSVLSMAVAASVQAQTSELNPVVVTAAKYEEDSQRVPAFINVITRQQIEQSGATTVNEAIMRLAGAPGSPSLFGGNEYVLDLMGFGDTASGNTVVVIDGVPIREGDASEVRLSGISIDKVERIEIQRGGAGVLYGEGATAGVINVVTRASANNSPTKHTGTVSAAFGSKNTREYRGYGNYVNDVVDLSLSALRRTSDGFRAHSNNEQKTGDLSFKYRLTEATRFGLAVSSDEVYALTPGALTLQEYRQNPKSAQGTSLDNKTFMDVKAERYAGFLETNLAGFKMRFDVAKRQRLYEALSVSGGSPTPMTFDTNNQYYSLTAQRSFDTDSYRNSLIIGVESNHWVQGRIYPTRPSWAVTNDSTGNANYAKSDLDFKKTGTRLSAGFRTEEFDRSQQQTAGKPEIKRTLQAWELGFSQSLNSENSVFARRSQSYRLPNLDELASPGYLGNTPIPFHPQIEKTNEVGWKFISAHANSSVRLYQSKLTDEIIYDPALWSNINLPKTTRQGLDAFSRIQVTRALGLTAAYSYRRAEMLEGANSGNQLPMAPQDVITLRGDWQLNANHNLGLGWMHVADQFIAGDFTNQNSMPSYRVVDARYRYQMGASDISVIVRNLMDAKYYSYATTTNNFSVYPDFGRSVVFALRYKF